MVSLSAVSSWLQDAVGDFGATCQEKLAGSGDREAAIRSPLEMLLKTAVQGLGVPAVFHDEVRDADRRVRPDYRVSVAGAVIGYIEVKALDDPRQQPLRPVCGWGVLLPERGGPEARAGISLSPSRPEAPQSRC